MEEPEGNQLIHQMPTLKTANVDHLQRAIEYRLYNFAAIIEPYDRDFHIDTSLSLPIDSNKEASTKSVVDLLLDEKNMVAIHLLSMSMPIAPEIYAERCLFLAVLTRRNNNITLSLSATAVLEIYGASGLTLTKKIYKHLCKLARLPNRQISVMNVDDYRICSDCDQRRLNNVRERRDFDGNPGQKIHALLKCNSCGKLWNRDVVSAKNIRYKFWNMAANNNQVPLEPRQPP